MAAISRTRDGEIKSPMDSFEAKSIAPVSSAIGWLGTTASPFCDKLSVQSRMQ